MANKKAKPHKKATTKKTRRIVKRVGGAKTKPKEKERVGADQEGQEERLDGRKLDDKNIVTKQSSKPDHHTIPVIVVIPLTFN